MWQLWQSVPDVESQQPPEGPRLQPAYLLFQDRPEEGGWLHSLRAPWWPP